MFVATPSLENNGLKDHVRPENLDSAMLQRHAKPRGQMYMMMKV